MILESRGLGDTGTEPNFEGTSAPVRSVLIAVGYLHDLQGKTVAFCEGSLHMVAKVFSHSVIISFWTGNLRRHSLLMDVSCDRMSPPMRAEMHHCHHPHLLALPELARHAVLFCPRALTQRR